LVDEVLQLHVYWLTDIVDCRAT